MNCGTEAIWGRVELSEQADSRGGGVSRAEAISQGCHLEGMVRVWVFVAAGGVADLARHSSTPKTDARGP